MKKSFVIGSLVILFAILLTVFSIRLNCIVTQFPLMKPFKDTIEIDYGIFFKSEEALDNDNSITLEKGFNAPNKKDYTNLDYKVLCKEQPVESQVLTANTIYEIRDEFNLNGQRLFIPENCVLLFTGGIIRNGKLIGRKTIIDADKDSLLFSDVIIEGEWKVKNIYSTWFNFENRKNNTNNLKNLFSLCAKEVINNVFIHKHTSYLTGVSGWNPDFNSEGFVFMIPSNTHIHNLATFIVEPNSASVSYIFNFYNVHDCSWDGGLLIGDVENHHSDKGEWGYGFSLRGARNIVISNVYCKDFWGDGINLQFCRDKNKTLINSENIVISNVVFDRNRRQGLSIESGKKVTVKECIFKNTGQLRGTSPQFGIDIEPIPGNPGVFTDDILIEKCHFENNVGGGINFRSISAENIVVRKCSIDNRVFWSGHNCFGKGGFKFLNSSLGRVEFTESTEGIYFENCVLTQFFGYKAGEEENNKLINFSLVSCSIASGDYVYREGWNNALLSLSQFSPKNVSGLIEGCTIKVKKDASIKDIFSFKANKSITIRNSLIECEKDNISLLCSAVFENNNIHLSKGYIYFTGIGIFKDNKVIYDQIVPNSGIIKIYNDAHIDILENEFNTPYEIEQNILFSHYGETANVSINLQKNKLPCETSSPISLPWATVLSRENESIIN